MGSRITGFRGNKSGGRMGIGGERAGVCNSARGNCQKAEGKNGMGRLDVSEDKKVLQRRERLMLAKQ